MPSCSTVSCQRLQPPASSPTSFCFESAAVLSVQHPLLLTDGYIRPLPSPLIACPSRTADYSARPPHLV
eukprot:jgi/Chlat1/2025/Chrsp158S02321